MNTTSTAAGLVAGFVVAIAFWAGAKDWLRHSPVLARDNYAGRPVPVAGGIPIIAATIIVLGVSILVRVGLDHDAAVTRIVFFEVPVAALVIGFGLLGLIDDILGDESRGFRGHLGALGKARITTGLFKLAGGAAIAVIALAAHTDSWGWLILEAALVSLTANLANLLDRAPGRLLKVSVVGGGLLVGFGWGHASVAAAAPTFGAGWAMLPYDLREKLMLGDTGANVVGAICGFVAVEISSRPVQAAILAGVVVLNLLSEVVSYSRVINSVAPLRWLDHLGRQTGS